jgi:hypothetical protein
MWGGEEVDREREDGGDLANVQCKSNQNCHYKSTTLYNEYILMKKNYDKK